MELTRENVEKLECAVWTGEHSDLAIGRGIRQLTCSAGNDGSARIHNRAFDGAGNSLCDSGQGCDQEGAQQNGRPLRRGSAGPNFHTSLLASEQVYANPPL